MSSHGTTKSWPFLIPSRFQNLDRSGLGAGAGFAWHNYVVFQGEGEYRGKRKEILSLSSRSRTGKEKGGNIWSVIGEGEHYDMVNMPDGLIWVDRMRDIQTTKHIIL